MQMIKENKGITLIALVVTIIILLILAGVSITTLSGNGLFGRAESSAAKYQAASEAENSTISDMLDKYDKYASNEVEFKINGVTYAATKGQTWYEWAHSSNYTNITIGLTDLRELTERAKNDELNNEDDGKIHYYSADYDGVSMNAAWGFLEKKPSYTSQHWDDPVTEGEYEFQLYV